MKIFELKIARKNKIIQEFRDQVKPNYFDFESLPNECLLKIMSFLSNYDVLRNVSGVSKRFYELSQDQDLISKIEVDSETWAKIQEGKYWEDFLKVLKRGTILGQARHLPAKPAHDIHLTFNNEL